MSYGSLFIACAIFSDRRILILDEPTSGLDPVSRDELTELLRQLSGVAVNINQIAKVANASGFVRMEDIAHIKAMQGMLWQAVKEL